MAKTLVLAHSRQNQGFGTMTCGRTTSCGLKDFIEDKRR